MGNTKEKASRKEVLISLAIAIVALGCILYWKSSAQVRKPAASRPKPITQSNKSEDLVPVKAALESSAAASSSSVQNPLPGLPDDLVRSLKSPPPELPEDLKAQLNAPPPELPEDLKRQLAAPPPELPEDLKRQLAAPPPELPEDIKQALKVPPRIVTADEVNKVPEAANPQ